MSSTAVPRCVICNSDVPIPAKRRVILIHPCSDVNADAHELFVSVVSPGCKFESTAVSYVCRVPCFSNLVKAVKHHVALQGLLVSLRTHQLVPQLPARENEPTFDHGDCSSQISSLSSPSLQQACMKDELVRFGILNALQC